MCQYQIDCSQPSILPFFYSIVERADGIARELDASADWVGGGERVLRACLARFLQGAYIPPCFFFRVRVRGSMRIKYYKG